MSKAKDAIVARISDALLGLVSDLPDSREPLSITPEERARQIAAAAAKRAALISSGLALPPGPLGLFTVVPDLLLIWKLQSQMVADIAACFGLHATLTREQMIYCLFRHAASQAVRDLVVRVGGRVLVKEASLQLIERTLRRVGVAVTQRVTGRAIARWVPVAGAAGVGAYAWYDTSRVAKTAIDFFSHQPPPLPPLPR